MGGEWQREQAVVTRPAGEDGPHVEHPLVVDHVVGVVEIDRPGRVPGDHPQPGADRRHIRTVGGEKAVFLVEPIGREVHPDQGGTTVHHHRLVTGVGDQPPRRPADHRGCDGQRVLEGWRHGSVHVVHEYVRPGLDLGDTRPVGGEIPGGGTTRRANRTLEARRLDPGGHVEKVVHRLALHAVASLLVRLAGAVAFITGDPLQVQMRETAHVPGQFDGLVRSVGASAVHAGVDFDEYAELRAGCARRGIEVGGVGGVVDRHHDMTPAGQAGQGPQLGWM